MKEMDSNLNRGMYELLLFVLVLVGCTSNAADSDNGLSSPSQPPSESNIARIDLSDGRPSAAITMDGTRVEISNGEATIGETMVIVTSRGDVEYHRTPTAIMEELSHMQVAYLVNGKDELVYFSGLEDNPRVDPASGELCWMAIECKNNRCASTMYFSFVEAGYKVDTEGNVVRPDARTLRQQPSTTRPCPHCGSQDFLVPYRSNESVERRQQLEAELHTSRAARTRAAH